MGLPLPWRGRVGVRGKFELGGDFRPVPEAFGNRHPKTKAGFPNPGPCGFYPAGTMAQPKPSDPRQPEFPQASRVSGLQWVFRYLSEAEMPKPSGVCHSERSVAESRNLLFRRFGNEFPKQIPVRSYRYPSFQDFHFVQSRKHRHGCRFSSESHHRPTAEETSHKYDQFAELGVDKQAWCGYTAVESVRVLIKRGRRRDEKPASSSRITCLHALRVLYAGIRSRLR